MFFFIFSLAKKRAAAAAAAPFCNYFLKGKIKKYKKINFFSPLFKTKMQNNLFMVIWEPRQWEPYVLYRIAGGVYHNIDEARIAADEDLNQLIAREEKKFAENDTDKYHGHNMIEENGDTYIEMPLYLLLLRAIDEIGAYKIYKSTWSIDEQKHLPWQTIECNETDTDGQKIKIKIEKN